MVPSRSRKTAGRSVPESGRMHLQGGEPGFGRGFDGRRRDLRHATMIDRAATEKTRAAVRFLLHDAATWRNGCGSVRICRSKYGNDWKTYSGRHMHRAGIVPDKEVALGKERRQIRDRCLTREVNGRIVHAGGNGGGHRGFCGCAEKNHVGTSTVLQPVGQVGEAIGWPTLRRAVRCARANGNAQRIGARSFAQKKITSLLTIFRRDIESDEVLLWKSIDPSRAAKQL